MGNAATSLDQHKSSGKYFAKIKRIEILVVGSKGRIGGTRKSRTARQSQHSTGLGEGAGNEREQTEALDGEYFGRLGEDSKIKVK